jgi:two-component system LytT family response regulator
MPTAPAISALIVDDEELGRLNLRYGLAAHAGWRLAGECANTTEARAALERSRVDVIFLDIQMPRESGLELARSLSAQAEPPLVIFVTAYNRFAVEAFEIHALDYLLKPFDDARLAQALERAAQMLALRQQAPYAQAMRAYLESGQRPPGVGPVYWQQLAVRSVGKIECVKLDQVFWIGAAGNYVELHMPGHTVLHRLPLSKLEEHLDPKVFLRAHRGAIVRSEQIASLEVTGDGSYLLSLRCGDTVPVSERYVQAIRGRMLEA